MLTRASVAVMGILVPALALAGQTPAPAPAPAPSAAQAAPAPPPATAPAAASQPAPDASAAPAGQIVVPVNTTIPLQLNNSVTTRTAQAGQSIYCTTIYPIVVNNRIVIPVGSYVKGQITQVIRPGRVKGKAQIGLRFDEITLPNGVTKRLRATLSGFGGSGNEAYSPKEGKIQGESTKGKDAEVVLVSGAEGAGIGSVAGISGGHSGAGAGVGGAAGALGGLIYVLASRGKDAVLPQGTNLELQLAVPLSYYDDEIQSPTNSGNGPALGRRDPGPGL
ncbi:MAG TPA: hypothetical protein VL523_12655 [Terriglobia bacterium]|nr:hypothetical protein [Terriglobia bacterium]